MLKKIMISYSYAHSTKKQLANKSSNRRISKVQYIANVLRQYKEIMLT